MARSIGYSSGIDGAYEKRKNHRMLLFKALFTPPRRRHAVAHGLDRHRRCWGDDLPHQPTGLMLKELPAHVRSYFQHPKVRYAAATIL